MQPPWCQEKRSNFLELLAIVLPSTTHYVAGLSLQGRTADSCLPYCPPGLPGAFLKSFSLASQFPVCADNGFFFLRCKTSHLYFSFSWVFLQLVPPPCWAVLLSTVSTIQSSMVLSLNLLRELSIPSSRALRYWIVSVSVLPVCWGTPFIKGCHLRLHSVGCCLLSSMI